MDGDESHLEAYEVEILGAAEVPRFEGHIQPVSDEALDHRMQCGRCAGRVIRFAETLKTTPLESYPPAE